MKDNIIFGIRPLLEAIDVGKEVDKNHDPERPAR